MQHDTGTEAPEGLGVNNAEFDFVEDAAEIR